MVQAADEGGDIQRVCAACLRSRSQPGAGQGLVQLPSNALLNPLWEWAALAFREPTLPALAQQGGWRAPQGGGGCLGFPTPEPGQGLRVSDLLNVQNLTMERTTWRFEPRAAPHQLVILGCSWEQMDSTGGLRCHGERGARPKPLFSCPMKEHQEPDVRSPAREPYCECE